MNEYRCYNGHVPTTAAIVKVTTGNVIKTMLQIAPAAGIDLDVFEWGISFDGSAAATPGTVELIETDVAATVTAYTAGDAVPMNNPAGPAAQTTLIAFGTATSGFTATAEGSITTTRLLDAQLIAPTNQFIYQWPLRNAKAQAGKFLRIRVTFGAAINALCYVNFGA